MSAFDQLTEAMGVVPDPPCPITQSRCRRDDCGDGCRYGEGEIHWRAPAEVEWWGRLVPHPSGFGWLHVDYAGYEDGRDAG